ncbi:MAG: RagB/SusD family nutrient uptake outer membrane protein [Bacteroidales bacterium]
MKKIFAIIPALLLGLSSCNYLDIEPVGEVMPESISDYRAILTSGYVAVPTHKQLLNVRADELNMVGSDNYYMDVARWNDSNADPMTVSYPWIAFYKAIFYANTILQDGIHAKPDGSESLDQLVGEAYLLRALMHFELVNMFSKHYDAATAATDKGIPLSLKIDIEQDYKRENIAAVYESIESDIEKGTTLLSIDSQSGTNKYRFSKVSAYAFKARVALYKKEYAKALESAEQVIKMAKLSDLNTTLVSPANYLSEESLLALEYISNQTIGGKTFEVTERVLNAYDAENDLRPALYFSNKILKKGQTNAERVSFRTAEAYLIAAEAAIYMDQPEKAIGYLKALASHRLKANAAQAKGAALQAMTKEELITEIAQERTRELAGEGHRWYDLRRTTQEEISKIVNNQTVTLSKGDPRYTIRIPKEAIEANPNLQD